VGKPEGKKPLGTLRYTWKDCIRMDLWGGFAGRVKWIQLAQDRGCCECGDEPSASIAT
jgi:hypothetical protein